MFEPQTASELMMESNVTQMKQREASVVLPSEEVQNFLINVVSEMSFPGKMAEFVAYVKGILQKAEIQ